MCSCKNKNLNQGQKSVVLAEKKGMTVSAQQKAVKKTREQLIAELRQRIRNATR